MSNALLLPPITFLIFIVLGMLFSRISASWGAKGEDSPGKYESYACGQSGFANRVTPDYSQFFPYAFFFTIMHVLVLIVATVPANALTLPLLYIVAGILAMIILFRR